jgi:peptidyl-prolyl cis-trans isomerase SurA
MNKPITTILLFIIAAFTLLAFTANQSTDRIIAIVNDRIILKSDVDREISDYMQQMQMANQPIEFNESLWYEVLESMIDNYILLEKARIDSIIVSDELVDRQMDQRIQQMVQQAGSEQALEQAFGQSIVELRAEYREQFREQMLAQQVRERIVRDVNITRPEVIEFFESIPTDSLPTIPEQVALSQIVVIPEPLRDAQQAALEKARQIRDSIVVHGKSFEEMARRHSSSPDARNGGELPLMPMSDLVSEYSAAAAALEPGEVSGVVRTSFGYHIIRLNERVGDNIATNNLLITIDEGGLDEEAARNKLEAIRDSVLHHDKRFSDMARRHSDDEFTRSLGGRMMDRQTGERLLALNNLDPALYRIVLLLDEEGEISEPRSFNPQTSNRSRAFRIVRLDQHVPEHIANLEQDFDRIRNIALQQKQMEKLTKTLERLRDQVYIEYKIDVPDRYREPQIDIHDVEFETQTPLDTE